MKKNTDLLIKFHTSVFFSSTVCLISSRPEQLAFHFSEWYVSSFAYVASAQFGTTTLKHLLSGLPRNFLSQHKLFSSLNRYHWGYKPAHSQPTQKHCAIWERNKVMCKYFIGCSETGFSFSTLINHGKDKERETEIEYICMWMCRGVFTCIMSVLVNKRFWVIGTAIGFKSGILSQMVMEMILKRLNITIK